MNRNLKGQFIKSIKCRRGHLYKEHMYYAPGGSYYCKKCASIRAEEIKKDPIKLKNIRISARKSQLKIEYNITLEDEKKLFKVQKKRCAICFTLNPKAKNWSIDHDHNTGKVRAILCNTCNAGLGQFKDTPELVLMAYKYLKKHKAKGHAKRIRHRYRTKV